MYRSSKHLIKWSNFLKIGQTNPNEILNKIFDNKKIQILKFIEFTKPKNVIISNIRVTIWNIKNGINKPIPIPLF